MPKISIIVPAYNAKLFIQKCINSVLQNKGDYEILIIDDGSNDNTLEHCFNLYGQNSKVRIFNKKNGGASSARNFGIRKSQGDYIMFLDSDDFWESKTCISNILKALNSTVSKDLILFGVETFNTISSKSRIRVNYSVDDILFLNSHSFSENLHYLDKYSLFPSSAWSVVIKKDFILKHNLFFSEGIVAEDIDWMLGVMINMPNITAIEENFYRYQELREGSVTSSSSNKAVSSLLSIIKKWKLKLHSNNNLNKPLLNFLSFHYATLFLAFSKLDPIDKKQCLSEIKQHLHLLDNLKSKQKILIKVLINIFGLEKGSKKLEKIYKVYLKIK